MEGACIAANNRRTLLRRLSRFSMYTLTIPLFPLNTVLFPGGPLPLRIFEPRYLDMVSDCVRASRPFGVCLISEGSEVGAAAAPHDIGTLASIIDWNRLPDGLLGITAEGGDRFSIHSTTEQPNRLLTAEVAVIPEDAIAGVPTRFARLVELLREAIQHAGPLYTAMDYRFDDAGWVSYRLAELLPLDNAIKQRLLETSSPVERLELIHGTVRELIDL